MKLVKLSENRDGYQPSQEEIQGYGEYLGLTFPQDDKFKPLLYEALTASLPEGWEACEIDGDEGTLVYRNIETNEVQESHPLDLVYKQKIFMIKGIAEGLNIDPIIEEKESWLKESSELMGIPKQNEDFTLGNESILQNEKRRSLISQISQQKSQTESEDLEMEENLNLMIESNRKQKKVPFKKSQKQEQFSEEKLKEQLMKFVYVPTFGLHEVKNNRFPVFNSQEEYMKMEEIKASCRLIDEQKMRLKKMEREKKRKLQYLQVLKSKIKTMQS